MKTQTKRTSQSTYNPYFDTGRIQVLQLMLCGRLDEVVAELGLGLSKSSKMYYGCCPIHGGDNTNALNLYVRGDSVPGFWRCNTRKCHETFKRTIVGFIRGVLSHQKYGWSTHRDKKKQDAQKTVSFKEAVDWCCHFLGQKIHEIKVDYAEIEKRAFAAGVAVLTRKPEPVKNGITRGQIRPRLEIPASYFVERGWDAETLNRYDVGFCGDPSKPMHDRVVVPVYDEDYRIVVGYTARSIYQRCEQCGFYHKPGLSCPDRSQHLLYSKWRNSTGFNKESHLYNYWLAKKHIRNSGVVCLCEGPGDVWRLEEAGIKIGVGMFGVDLSDTQKVILEMSGAASVVILTNNDATGNSAYEVIRDRLKRCFRVYRPVFTSKDLGELPPAQVRELLLPILTPLAKRT